MVPVWMMAWSLILSLTLSSVALPAVSGFKGIPGLAGTNNGYDVEMGTDAICWTSQNAQAAASEEASFEFPNVLVSQFRTDQTGIQLLSACPGLNRVDSSYHSPTSLANVDNLYESDRFRTGKWYNFTVDFTIDLAPLQSQTVVSDSALLDGGKARISVQIVACDTTVAGFCSPFVHEQADARIFAAAGKLTKTPVGELHGGTHVHSPFLELDIDLHDADSTVLHHSVEVPLLVNVPGSYSMLSSVMWFVGEIPYTMAADGTIAESDLTHDRTNGTQAGLFRYDMANAMLGKHRIIQYQSPAIILEVSSTIQWINYVAAGLTSLMISYFLVQTIQHRQNSVFQLSQVAFMAAFQLAALMASMSTVLLQPTHSWHCWLSRPLVLCSLQFMYAIHIARLWRIHAVISPILKQQIIASTRHDESPNWCLRSTRISKLCDCWRIRYSSKASGDGPNSSPSKQTGMFRRKSNPGFRRHVAPWKVVAIVVIVMIPQVVLQILAYILQSQHRAIEFNDDESIGRATCRGVGVTSPGHSIMHYCVCTILLSLLILLWLARASSELPSLFDESKAIYDSTVTNGLLWIFGLGIVAITDSPTISPDVEYLTLVVLVLSVTSTLTIKLIYPKLQLVWSGKQVLVSHLVAEHRQSQRSSSAGAGSGVLLQGQQTISGLHPPSSTPSGMYQHEQPSGRQYPPHSSRKNHTTVSSSYEDSIVAGTIDETTIVDEESSRMGSTDTQNHPSMPTKMGRVTFAGIIEETNADREPQEQQQQQQQQGSDEVGNDLHPQPQQRQYTIREDVTPSKNLIFRMVQLRQQIESVTQTVMSGLSVPRDDWVSVRHMTTHLGNTFQERVHFEWEDEQSDDEEVLPLVHDDGSTN